MEISGAFMFVLHCEHGTCLSIAPQKKTMCVMCVHFWTWIWIRISQWSILL